MGRGYGADVANHLLEPVARMGPEVVRELAFKAREDPQHMLTNYKVLDVRLVLPSDSTGGLEATVNQKPQILRPLYPSGKPITGSAPSSVVYKG